MITLDETLNNLQSAVEKYANVSLIETKELSEILRTLGVNLSWLVTLRKEYYQSYMYHYGKAPETSHSAKERYASIQVPELDYIRKILRHYENLQMDIRSQISLWKTID